MELINQRTKKIMEECKARARAAGLNIQGDTLEYIVTNQRIIELSPKVMIPTLYDYWVDDIEVIRDKWIYDAFPHNPYEICVNTRPAISFYNDNNADWLNTMIFYHVLGHIDFFQNNAFFRHTWNDDFCGAALADKRLISSIRVGRGAEKRWVEYVIEFARLADNLVGYYAELEETDKSSAAGIFGAFSERADFYFGEFLRRRHEDNAIKLKFYHEELERYGEAQRKYEEKGDIAFFEGPDFKSRFPEFESVFKKHKEKNKSKSKPKDILQHLIENSKFIGKDENQWMKDVLGVVRRTSLYFQPQIRTKIGNEGWASVWHERLFITDERVKSHETDFARVNSDVLVDRRLGLNPYIIGKRLWEFIEELAAKGKLSYEYQLIKDVEQRKRYDKNLGEAYGKKVLFESRERFDDAMLINFLSDADFQDFVDKHNLFVAGRRLNRDRWTIETYIKSRNGKKYRKAMNDALYHPPYVVINPDGKAKEGELYLDHVYEGRTLVTRYIEPVLRGLSFLWGDAVKLETTEFESRSQHEDANWENYYDPEYKPPYHKVRSLYSCEGRDVTRITLSREEGN